MVWLRRTLHINILMTLVTLALVTGCMLPGKSPGVTATTFFNPGPSASPVLPQSITLAPTIPASTPTAITLPSETIAPTSSCTPDLYAAYTIDYLVNRSYGGGELRAVETLAVNSYFTRTLVSYPSDGLTIYGFTDSPRRISGNPGDKLPVIIALHGYIDPAIYSTLDYTARYADALARAGFLVIHPNLRGYAPSDDGDNLFRVGMAIDVLNLIAVVKEQAGKPGLLERADPGAIGVWGHSMGGGITTRVITVSPDVRAAVLYSAMSGDDLQNYKRIYSYFSDHSRGQEELSAPEDAFRRISPIYYLDRIQAAVSIHHGEDDPDVPLAWSLDLCQRLNELGKSVECFTYAGEPHTFHGDGDVLFIERTITFFKKWLIK